MIIFWVLVYGALRIIQANCNKQTSNYMNSMWLFFRYGIFFEFASAFFSFIYVLIVGFYGFNSELLICSFLSGACFVTELITSLEALKGAPLVLCNLCSMSGGIILVSIVAIFFFDEPMTIIQWTGVGLFFLASYCLSGNSRPETVQSGKRISAKTLLILTLNFLINGICGVVGKYYAVKAENGNAALFSFFTYACSTVLFTILLLWYWKKHTKYHSAGDSNLPIAQSPDENRLASHQLPALPRKLYVYGSVLGATCSSIVFLSTTLSRTVPVVILNTVPGIISIVGCLFIGALLFHEKITKKNTIGVLLGILSVVMIVC